MNFVRGFWRIARWPILVVVVILGGLFLYHLARYPQLSRDTVQAIQSQKITAADVDGTNLPPVPNAAEVDATIEGVDANTNGIRDDVELAIFEKYPSDRKVRAAALQYAKAEQLFLTSVFNTATWKAAAEVDGRANLCVRDIGEIKAEVKTFVERIVLNTESRRLQYERAHRFTTSYGAQSGPVCDIE